MMQPFGAQPPLPQSAMRAAQADRERTVDVLRAAFAEGRLSIEEYHERVGAAQAAQTYGQLGALVQDLPVGPMPTPMMLQPPMPQPPLLPPVPQAPSPLFARPGPPPYGYPRGYPYGAPGPYGGYLPYGHVRPGVPLKPAKRTNGAAVASLLLGLGQFLTVGVTAVPALIFGLVAQNQLKERDEDGAGLATTGIVLGSLGAVFWGLLWLLGVARP